MSGQPPVALTIAGSDSGGGAGIQADLRTFAAHGVFGTSAITAVTAQNTLGVSAVHQVPPDAVVAQVLTVLEDLPVAAVKTGMLGSRAVVEAVADLAAQGILPHLVVDPVAVATSGDRLLDVDAERAYVELLLPHTAVLTPNEREAGVLLGRPVRTLADRHQAAADLAALGPRVVVVTGGDGDCGDDGAAITDASTAVDVVWWSGATSQLACPRVTTTNTHGTGCTYSAALAAALAHGLPLPVALQQAKSYVHRALTSGVGRRLGGGCGPVDPLGTPAGCLV